MPARTTATKKKRTTKKSSMIAFQPGSESSMPEPRMEMTSVITSQIPDPTDDPTPSMPEPSPMPEPMPGPQEGPTSCANCAHIPMGPSTVITVMIGLVFTLSSLLVASAMVIDSQQFQLQAYASHGYVGTVAQR